MISYASVSSRVGHANRAKPVHLHHVTKQEVCLGDESQNETKLLLWQCIEEGCVCMCHICVCLRLCKKRCVCLMKVQYVGSVFCLTLDVMCNRSSNCNTFHKCVTSWNHKFRSSLFFINLLVHNCHYIIFKNIIRAWRCRFYVYFHTFKSIQIMCSYVFLNIPNCAHYCSLHFRACITLYHSSHLAKGLLVSQTSLLYLFRPDKDCPLECKNLILLRKVCQ